MVVVSTDMAAPISTIAQLAPSVRKTWAAVGALWLIRVKASVSCSERRRWKINGMMAQPSRSGMRHPKLAICSAVRRPASAAPSSAAIITATC